MKKLLTLLVCLLLPVTAWAGLKSSVGTTAGTGMSVSGNTVTSSAVARLTWQPGTLAAVAATKAGFYKVGPASTVDNIVASASLFTCSVNPTVTVFECGTSTTCAVSPVTIGTATLTAAGTAVPGTVNSSSITAGDYVAFALTAGTCTSLDMSTTVQTHAN